MRLRGNIKLIAGAAALVVLAAVIVILVVFFMRSQEPEIPGLVSASVEGDEPTILENDSGAKIVVPALESNEDITVSIRKVPPPVSHVSIGEVFDFSIVDEAGQDVSLDQPVAITLPYSLPEGREHSDVVVLHWNETEGKWDPVEGGDIDQAAQTITVQVSHLSTFGISWLLTFAEFLANSAEALIGTTFGQHYEQGNKHLLALKASGGTHKVNGEVSLIIDVDDLLGITEEGKAGYVTTWLNVTAGLGQISWSNTLPVGIYFFVHDRSEGDDDPRFKAKFKSLSGSATIGGHVVGLEALTVTNGKINPASGNYQVCLTCTEDTLGVSLSWADLTWNANKAELRLRPDDSLFNPLKGSLGPIDGSTEEISAEEFASEVIGSTFEVIGDEIRAIFDEPSAPFTSYDQPSPELAIDWYGSLQNQIVGHCGGENRYGPSSRLCSDGDMIFPSHTDSSGSPVVETPLRLWVKGDARETRDYFVKLVDISPGWEIKVDRDSNLWSTLVTLVLYDDRAQFEARAGAVHSIPFLAGNTSFAPNPGVATFKLVHVKGFADDKVLDLYRVELWQGREVSDLSVTATPNSIEATSGDSTTVVANVTNRGPNSVNQVALHIDVTDSENILFSSASTSGGANPCRTLYFGKLLCELGALNPNQSAAVNLNFSLSGSGSPIGGDYVHLQVSSPVYDPQSSNNYLTSTILISPSTTGPTQPQPPPPIVQPPLPTDASDREALIALYDATRGEYWYNNRNGNEVWDVDEVNSDISSWHGVTVNSAGRVTGLDLYSNSLRYDRDHRNSLPPELGNLAYLWSLVLSDNDLRGRIPDAFGNLGNLVELDLNDNSLSGNIPASLGNLTSLEALDLSNNNLSGEIPAGLGSLPRMDVVYLGGNNLSGCVPAEWRRVQGDPDELGLPFCDVALNDLTISPGRLSPEFEVSESSYTAEIPAYETTIAPANYQGASFQFLDAGGNVLTDADSARPGHQVQLTAATTAVTILVTSQDGRREGSYTIGITRSPGGPGTPVINPATPGPATLALSWSAPSNSGTSPISSYSLRYRVAGPGGGAPAPWTVIQSVWNPSLGGLSYDLTGLQPSVRYELQMRAVNNSGPGPWSATVTGATASALPPGMPLNSTAAPADQTGIRLSWGRPSSDGGSPITGYRIQSSEDGSTWATLVANARPGILTYSHTALSAGSTWHYRVAAINSVGQGPWSNVATASTESPVTPQVPGPPINPAATAEGSTSIRLTWRPPASSGSSAVSRYQLEVSVDGVRWSPLAAVGPLTTSYTHTGLPQQSARRYRVAAANAAGLGEWSVVFSATTESESITTLPVEPPVSGSPEGDRIALVAFYNSTGGPNWVRNDSWLSGAPLSQWYGVTTDSGGRVTDLKLSEHQLSGRLPAELGNLTGLRVLDLGNRSYSCPRDGCVPGSPSGNQLTGVLPAELGNLKQLEQIVLSANSMTGPIPQWLGNLPNLKRLDLAGNRFVGFLPQELGRLKNLEQLRLGNNFLEVGPIPDWIRGLNKLRSIDLASSDLRGPLPAWFGELTRLSNLDLTANRLTGPIPPELARLAEMRTLGLGGNEFTGPLPAFLGAFTKLQNLSVASNRLSGPIPKELGNLTELRFLFLANAQLTGCVPAGLQDVEFNDFQSLNLPFCATSPTTAVPQPPSGGIVEGDRAALVAFYNATGGPFWANKDNWLTNTPLNEWHGVTADANGRVTEVALEDNGLTGSLPPNIGQLSELRDLVLRTEVEYPCQWVAGPGYDCHPASSSPNRLSGALPSELGNLSMLKVLDLQGNQFSGEIPAFLSRLGNLETLYLGENDFTGRIPPELGNLSNLTRLYLGYNQLAGNIPPQLGNLPNLKELLLWASGLTGTLPRELTRLSKLERLSVGGNRLTGEIPLWLGNLTSLRELHIVSNQFSGNIPAEMGSWKSLRSLHLGWNQLTGPIPPELDELPELEYLQLEANQLSGCIPQGLRDVADNDLDNLGLPYCN